MSRRALYRLILLSQGAFLGFFASLAFCRVQGVESDRTIKAQVMVFGRGIHEESVSHEAASFDHFILKWGCILNAGFAVVGVGIGALIATVLDQVIKNKPPTGNTNATSKRGIKNTIQALRTPDALFAAVATITFPLAVLLPFFTLSPSFGDVMIDAILDYLSPGTFDPRTYSVLGGIAMLFTSGDLIVALVLLLFSVFFPAVKLALLWGVLLNPEPAKLSLVHRLETLGPWSMADVFVVSVLVVAFKGFPGGTTFTIESGYYVFLVSVITGLLATWLAKRRLQRVTGGHYQI